VYMNFVQPASEWCGELLHADCGAGVVRSFNYGPFSRSFIVRNLSLVVGV
jgi:hypothetical protein